MYFKLHFDNSIKAVLKWRNVHCACELTLSDVVCHRNLSTLNSRTRLCDIGSAYFLKSNKSVFRSEEFVLLFHIGTQFARAGLRQVRHL
jgi:hypothetical protein